METIKTIINVLTVLELFVFIFILYHICYEELINKEYKNIKGSPLPYYMKIHLNENDREELKNDFKKAIIKYPDKLLRFKTGISGSNRDIEDFRYEVVRLFQKEKGIFNSIIDNQLIMELHQIKFPKKKNQNANTNS